MSDTNRPGRVTQYWEEFYAGQIPASINKPSNFVMEVAKILRPKSSIIDFGCGTGRDSIYLAYCGHSVYPIDQSASAIALVKKLALPNLEPHVGAEKELAALISRLRGEGLTSAGLYMRFLLHAVDSKTENSLFDLISENIPFLSPICLEYRTTSDVELAKCFGSHYRRYIEHGHVKERLIKIGYETKVDIEGRGLAKFEQEDPYVGRIIAVWR
jgi:SAM-dependent methyltransferase